MVYILEFRKAMPRNPHQALAVIDWSKANDIVTSVYVALTAETSSSRASMVMPHAANENLLLMAP
jgi:hypothetical protein